MGRLKFRLIPKRIDGTHGWGWRIGGQGTRGGKRSGSNRIAEIKIYRQKQRLTLESFVKPIVQPR